MIAGLAKIFYTPRRDVASWGACGIGFALVSGKVWSELPFTVGNLTTKSEKNPLVSSFEISADCPNSLPDSVAMGLKYEQQVYIAVTKEGRYLLIGSDMYNTKVTVKQESGEVVGDFQGDKVVVEGVIYGKMPEVSALFAAKKPTVIVDSSVVPFENIFRYSYAADYVVFHNTNANSISVSILACPSQVGFGMSTSSFNDFNPTKVGLFSGNFRLSLSNVDSLVSTFKLMFIDVVLMDNTKTTIPFTWGSNGFTVEFNTGTVKFKSLQISFYVDANQTASINATNLLLEHLG